MNPTSVLPLNMQKKITVVGDCWEWWGAKNSRGYGSVADGKGGSALAHRRAYELAVGPIPEGLQIDHLCMNKVCVNPEHLEPVTQRENMRRQYKATNGGHLPDFGPLADPRPAPKPLKPGQSFFDFITERFNLESLPSDRPSVGGGV